MVNPWHPMTDPVDLKHLGKLAEELGEATAAVSRCIIQGIDEKEPMTSIINRDWLTDELADVIANIDLVCRRFNLDGAYMLARIDKKTSDLTAWHNMA